MDKDLIERITKRACEIAEKARGIYTANIYAIYLSEK